MRNYKTYLEDQAPCRRGCEAVEVGLPGKIVMVAEGSGQKAAGSNKQQQQQPAPFSSSGCLSGRA